MIYLSGPGHGGNAMVAQDWLDGSYSEVYPNVSQDEEGMQIMRTLGRNMAFLIKSIQLGKEQFGLPEKEPRVGTNFIR